MPTMPRLLCPSGNWQHMTIASNEKGLLLLRKKERSERFAKLLPGSAPGILLTFLVGNAWTRTRTNRCGHSEK